MVSFDKGEIRSSLTIDNIFELLQEWGGDPEYTDFGIISATICHNHPGDGSRKLYYYSNTDLYRCFTGCNDVFDIFELTIKVFEIQHQRTLSLNDAIRYIAFRFGIAPQIFDDEDGFDIADFNWLNKRQTRIENVKDLKDYHVQLKEYDDIILSRFNHNVKILPWLNEGISQEAMDKANICFYPGGDQIVIPHYDVNNRLVGIRGRTLCQEDGEKFGKYRPLRINGLLYNHPLGMNLYNLNNSKDAIKTLGKAIVFEGEKSPLLYQTYFGSMLDISVACCGSSLSVYQVQLLIDAGAKEIVVAFDRQYQEAGDAEFEHLTSNLRKIKEKYKNEVIISIIFDYKKRTKYKASPIDAGRDIFIELYNERNFLDEK